MLKKIFTLIFILVFSTVSIFAQEESEDSANKPREALLKDFVDALASQDESLLLSAIEMGSPEVKALCFQALSESGASSDLLIQAINRYVDYGLTTSYGGNSDSLADLVYLRLHRAERIFRSGKCSVASQKIR